MKKRIAEKIYRRVYNDFTISVLNGYTFGINPFIGKRDVILHTPLSVYSHNQFRKACKVLNKPIPKVSFGFTPVKPKNIRYYFRKSTANKVRIIEDFEIRPSFKEYQKKCIERFMITHKMKIPEK